MQSRVILLPKRLRFLFPFSWSGLRARMALAYVSVTLGSVLSFLLLTVLASGALSAVFSDSLDSNFLTVLQRQAQSYAQIAALQAQGEALDPHTSFIPGQAHTLALPYLTRKIWFILCSPPLSRQLLLIQNRFL